jgi:lipopolysaccharide transport system ATP-binding protein
MSDNAITVEHLSKRYTIGARLDRHATLRDRLAGAIATPPWRRGPREAAAENAVWALKDVSFEVKPGEAIGVIGRNGAGTSTLLKILSRITEPAEGRVRLRGRVGSLLDVGTGFHPELTGRENTYLNGAILGMRRAEIDRRFDEIVAFAEIEQFLDTPVKHYSSGMYVRLAFAVAAHLEPEILLVDEVLAVGDMAFQQKCLGRMRDVAGEGRTVLFVSHNLGAIQALTSRSLLLFGGRLAAVGATQDVIDVYLNSLKVNDRVDVAALPRLWDGHGRKVKILSVEPVQPSAGAFCYGEALVFHIGLEAWTSKQNLRIGVTVTDAYGNPVMTAFSPARLAVHESARMIAELRLNDTRLAPGTYSLSLSVGEGQEHEAKVGYDLVRSALMFTVSPVSSDGDPIYEWMRHWGSVVHSDVDVEMLAEEATVQG